MTLLRLISRNIRGNAFRSLVVFLCAALVAGLALTATFVIRGAEASLRHNLERLGADILVLPWGTMTEKIGGVRLMSAVIDGWMPETYLERIAALDGVAEVSPQLYLATLPELAPSGESEVYLVAYDPATDFVLAPWAERGRTGDLAAGEAIVGASVASPDTGDTLSLYGHDIRVADRLEATATSIDNTIFVNFETAGQLAAATDEGSRSELKLRPGAISAIMVKVALGRRPHDVALRILEQTPGIVPLETPNLFQAERQQMVGVLRTMLGLLGVIWATTLVFMGLVFSIAANERRWEIGVLRAIGLSRRFILKALLLEGAALAAAGGLVGVVVSVAALATFGDRAVSVIRLPLQMPSPVGLISLSLGGQALALASVTLAAFLPAWRISHEEVALSMRE